MRTARLEDMVKGWFVGNFEPSLIKTNDVEVAVKSYNKGDYEEKHYHKIATELTVIIQGRVKMNRGYQIPAQTVQQENERHLILDY